MSRRHPRRRAAALIAVLVTGIALAACGLGSATTVTRPPSAGHHRPVGIASGASPTVPSSTLVATLPGTVPRFASPGGPQTGTVPGTWQGSPSELPVVARRPGWLDVRLAQRPNGSTAWVLAKDVSLARSPYAIVVDLTARRLTLYRNGVADLSAPVSIGMPATPTPTGHYFVALFASPPSPGYGAFVMVTSAHSNAITDWDATGDAIVAIHGPLGTDAEIGTAGAAVSHGCIRLHESDLARLRPVPAGSPIEITT